MKRQNNSKIIVVFVLSFMALFFLSIGQAGALSVNLIPLGQIEFTASPTLIDTDTPLPTFTFTPTITPSPTITVTPSPTNTISPAIDVSPPMSVQVEGLISWKIMLQILITGAVIGAVFAYLTRISALKLLSVRLDKLGIALGVEGFEPEEKNKGGVSLNNVKDSQFGDIAVGSTIDKSTNLRQFISNIDEKLEKSTEEINQKLGKFIGDDLDNFMKAIKDYNEKKGKNQDKDESFIKQVGDISTRLNELAERLDILKKNGEEDKEIYTSLEKKIETINLLLSKLPQESDNSSDRMGKRSSKTYAKKRRNRNL